MEKKKKSSFISFPTYTMGLESVRKYYIQMQLAIKFCSLAFLIQF